MFFADGCIGDPKLRKGGLSKRRMVLWYGLVREMQVYVCRYRCMQFMGSR